MKNKTVWGITAIFLLILGGAFYWFEYRPSRIRSDCEWFAGSQSSTLTQKENKYRFCLNSKGLEK